MSFGQNVAATKIELFKYKKSTQIAVMVQQILDDKRKVLLKNIEEMIQEASKARFYYYTKRWNSCQYQTSKFRFCRFNCV